ncbi:helix-turn-helix domain-containing protein [Streptomyces sp. x-80]|uniref:helix-turn-helix domain-containing protein n=1 Tax=Streptomyces sp. x-80 TaxID=2789282 RepID=UPI00398092FD
MQPKRLGLHMAERLPRLARELLGGEYTGEDLATLLRRARELIKEVENYSAGAVLDARRRGASWDSVARDALISPHTARDRWSEAETERRLSRQLDEHAAHALRLPTQPSTRLPPSSVASASSMQDAVGSAERAARLLADALCYLHESSGIAPRDVADSMGVSPSYVSRILSANRLPAWPVVQAMMEQFGEDPAMLRHLWEISHGLVPAARPSVTRAADRVFHALRGLYTAARRPDPDALHRDCAEVLSPATIELVLSGGCMPDWPEVSVLVTALNGDPEDVRPLWEEFHYVWLHTFDQSLAVRTDGLADSEKDGELH